MNSATAMLDEYVIADHAELKERRRVAADPLATNVVSADNDSAEPGPLPRRAPLLAPIWKRQGQLLARPLFLKFEISSDGTVIGNERLRIWGVGDNAYSALADFWGTFDSVLAGYRDMNERDLTSDAIAFRDELMSFLP